MNAKLIPISSSETKLRARIDIIIIIITVKAATKLLVSNFSVRTGDRVVAAVCERGCWGCVCCAEVLLIKR